MPTRRRVTAVIASGVNETHRHQLESHRDAVCQLKENDVWPMTHAAREPHEVALPRGEIRRPWDSGGLLIWDNGYCKENSLGRVGWLGGGLGECDLVAEFVELFDGSVALVVGVGVFGEVVAAEVVVVGVVGEEVPADHED